MKFDTSQNGLNTLYKPYQSVILEHIWDLNNENRTGIASSQAYILIQKTGDSELMKSRASVINFLNDMVEEGILSYEDKTGKGGYHKVYFPEMDKEQFAAHIVEIIAKKLKEVFPDFSLRDRL